MSSRIQIILTSYKNILVILNEQHKFNFNCEKFLEIYPFSELNIYSFSIFSNIGFIAIQLDEKCCHS